MTDEEIIVLAEKYSGDKLSTYPSETRVAFLEFARALIAAEREACAQACDLDVAKCLSFGLPEDAEIAAGCANAIRKRGQS